MTTRFIAAVPVVPAFTGAIDTRQVPGVRRRILQVAVRVPVLACVATVHVPRTAFAPPARRVALIRYVVSAPAANVATTARVVTRDFDQRTPVGVAGGTLASADVGSDPGAEAAVGVTASDAADGDDAPYPFDAVAVNV